MIRRLVAWTMFACLAACAGGKGGPPAWREAASSARDSFVHLYLRGDEVPGNRAYALAREALQDGGDIASLRDLELTRCALERARLLSSECADSGGLFDAQMPPLTPRQRAYRALIGGNVGAAEIGALPERYQDFARALLNGNDVQARRQAAGISDPVSRLIAIGIAYSKLLADEELLVAAGDTARAAGYRATHVAIDKALLALLESNGDSRGVATIRARLRALE